MTSADRLDIVADINGFWYLRAGGRYYPFGSRPDVETAIRAVRAGRLEPSSLCEGRPNFPLATVIVNPPTVHRARRFRWSWSP